MQTEDIKKENIEETEEKEEKKKKRRLPLFLILILILLLITTAILGSRLYNMATRDRYTVDLGIGDMNGTIELFRIEYSNQEGEITVQGVNGENVVAPGTTVGYDIRLRNKGDVVIDFLMTPAVEFLTKDMVPVEFKVKDDFGNYILGNDNTWVSYGAMNALEHKGTIHPGEVFTYHVSWRWVFEVSDGQNAYDTYLGNQDGQLLPGVKVSIETQATANPTPTRSNTHTMHLLGQGFGCCWCCWLVLILLVILLLMCLWVRHLRKKLDEQEETLEEYEEVLEAHGLMVDGELITNET